MTYDDRADLNVIPTSTAKVRQCFMTAADLASSIINVSVIRKEH